MTALYRHDGQMGIEDVEVPTSGSATVTRYGLGARGVDMIERTNGSGTVTAFPIYDAHGNNVASLTRSGTGYSIGDRRTYDAWGVVRSQQSGGDPKLRYCASLGHKADDESGLIYMRARYYEPVSGRFASEDRQRQGRDWFIYCGNNPVSRGDFSGNVFEDEWLDIYDAIELMLQSKTSDPGFVHAYAQQTIDSIDQFIDKVREWMKGEFVKNRAINDPRARELRDDDAAGEYGAAKVIAASMKRQIPALLEDLPDESSLN